MTIFDLKGDEALDALADVLEPFAAIFGDKELAEAYRSGKNMTAVKIAVKGHKKEVKELLARVDLQDPETYEISFMTLPLKLLTFFNRPEIRELFPSVPPKTQRGFSGSPLETTTAEEA